MLGTVGLLSEDEVALIIAALDAVETEIGAGQFEFRDSDEDIHSAVERRVTELAGSAGGKLHTGRSRNDQVATDLRLWSRRAAHEILALISSVQHALLAQAEAAGDARLPGYTHLQQAQPITLAHHLLAHGWALQRDYERLTGALSRIDISPLGAGALAGTSLPIDPAATAADLGFVATFENSLDAVSDRDFVAEVLFVLAMLGVHLSRMGEELVIWSSTEFGFVDIAEGYATGSSMMPQKKNPDLAELLRGKAGRLIGNLTGLLATLKGLPLSYNKDLQEDKEPLFDSVDTIVLSLRALEGLLATCRFDTDRMAAMADSPYSAATDLADWLVAQGTPFRDAHAVVADLVRASLEARTPFAEAVSSHPDLGDEAARLVEPEAATISRSSHGGGSPEAVATQMDRFRQAISSR
jgi:argininosuccinate lyase